METLEIAFSVIIIILMALAILVPLILGWRKKAKKKPKTNDVGLTKKIGAYVVGAPPIKIKDGQITTVDEDESGFQVTFDPELKNEIYCYELELKCRVNFFSKKGTVAVYKIWQHSGGKGRTRMRILDGKTKKVIDGGWSETNVFPIKKNEMRGVFLVFHRNVPVLEDNDIDIIGVKIETSEGTVIRDFKIRWRR